VTGPGLLDSKSYAIFGSVVQSNSLPDRVWNPKQTAGDEAAAWYRHFVDVVWLFLFVSIYWWGGN
jgi:heme/copper-type cytochrome/quinol oxidase subunit 3